MQCRGFDYRGGKHAETETEAQPEAQPNPQHLRLQPKKQ
jgi:hypothetical protein